MKIEASQIEAANKTSQDLHRKDFDYLREFLSRRNIKTDDLIAKLAALQVATPSWALGTGGTRFGRFPGPGEPGNLEEKIADLGRGSIAWLEPLRSWIKDSVSVGESAASPSLYDKKSSALKISGSNPLLKNRRIEFRPIPPSDALRASLKKFLETNDVLCLRDLYLEVRTYFIRNQA